MNISEIKSIVEYIVNKENSLQNKYYLVIQDIFEHLILREMYSTELFLERVAFKGGTALAKCYLNYHRFSVDLDFTYIHDEEAKRLSKTKKNRLNREVRESKIVPVLRDIEKKLKTLGFVFVYPVENRGFIMGNDVFASSFIIENELYKGEIRIEFNLGEDLHYAPRRVLAKTLMNMSVEEYSPVEVIAYAPQEILAEKYKAMLTRVLWRDYYDAYFLWMDQGKYPNDLREKIVEKGVRDLRREFLRKRFEQVRSNLENRENTLNRVKIGMEREKSMILHHPPMENFEGFVGAVIEQIIPIENEVEEKYIEERCRELVSKYTVSTRDGYRVNLRKMNDEDYRFYEEHQEDFNRIADEMYGAGREEKMEI